MRSPKAFTEQSLIEYVVPLLHAQVTKSQNSFGTCQYNGTSGRHCAIGFIIPPELYDPTWDDEGAGVLDFCKQIPSIKYISPNLLSELQFLHDDTEHGFNTYGFREDVENFCKNFSLDDAFLDELEFKE